METLKNRIRTIGRKLELAKAKVAKAQANRKVAKAKAYATKTDEAATAANLIATKASTAFSRVKLEAKTSTEPKGIRETIKSGFNSVKTFFAKAYEGFKTVASKIVNWSSKYQIASITLNAALVGFSIVMSTIAFSIVVDIIQLIALSIALPFAIFTTVEFILMVLAGLFYTYVIYFYIRVIVNSLRNLIDLAVDAVRPLFSNEEAVPAMATA